MIALDADKNLITWQYPTGKLIKIKDMSNSFVFEDGDTFVSTTDIHMRRRKDEEVYVLFARINNSKPSFRAHIENSFEDQNQDENGVMLRNMTFKVIKIENQSTLTVVLKFQLEVQANNYADIMDQV